MVAKVYVPVLFPLTFLIAWLAVGLDRWLGWDGGFLGSPVRWIAAATSLAVGLTVVGLAYADLVEQGSGSPSPVAGRTRRLVVSGLYAHCRNPSVWGKLAGVLSVGFALDSPSFCFLLMPVALGISLVEKVVRQEPKLVAVFGKDYEAYRSHVPLFIPRLTPWRRATAEPEATP